MKIILKVQNRSKSQHRELAAMTQENNRSKNEARLKKNLAAYNDLLTAYQLEYPKMEYKDVQREAGNFWQQLKARCTAGMFTKIFFSFFFVYVIEIQAHYKIY